MERNSSWKDNGSQLVEEIPKFMEPEGSLLLLQESPTCPYLEPDQSSPCPNPSSWKSILILSFHLRLGFPSGIFPSGFPPNSCMHLSCPLYVLHAQPISFFSILSPE